MESGWSIRDLGWPAVELPPWRTALVPIGLSERGYDVAAGAGLNILNPGTRTRHPTRVITRKDTGLSPIVNGWQLQYANR
jgi:hypothetical protein